MTQAVIALVGISGVGKSTLLRALGESVVFQHLQASALIKAAREAIEAVGHDDLRRVDIGDNQALLVEGFSRARDPNAQIVILDGHTVVDTPNGLVEIAPAVFAGLGIARFVLVVDEAEAVRQRRSGDKTRNRPERTAEELDEHQKAALLAAYEAARVMAVPLHVFSVSDVEGIRAVITG